MFFVKTYCKIVIALVVPLAALIVSAATQCFAAGRPAASIKELWHTQGSVMVMAHRGDHRKAPENTIPAYEAAIKAGAQFIEIDARLTIDNKWVIYHNRMIQSHSGERVVLSSMTFDEVRSYLIKGKSFGIADQKIPTLDEVLIAMKDKVLIYIDDKMGRPLALADIVRRHGMEDQVIIGIGDYADALLMSAFAPDIAWRARVKPMKSIMDKFIALKPKVIEVIDIFALTKQMIAQIHKAGAKIMVNSSDEGDVAKEYSVLVEQVNADIIQTDDLDRHIGFLEKRATRSTQLTIEAGPAAIN